LLDDGGDVDERRRNEVAELRLVRLEQQQLRGLNGLERACDSCPGCERAGALDGEERDGMVGIERIPVRVSDQHVRREFADTVGDGRKGNAVDLERVVAEVEALE